MSFNGKLVAVAALIAFASAGPAYAVTTIVTAPSGPHRFADGASHQAMPAARAAILVSGGADLHGGAYRSVADFSQHAVDARDTATGQAAVSRARGALASSALEAEPSPYTMLLMGAGMMLLVGRSRGKNTPWASSPVEEPAPELAETATPA